MAAVATSTQNSTQEIEEMINSSCATAATCNSITLDGVTVNASGCALDIANISGHASMSCAQNVTMTALLQALQKSQNKTQAAMGLDASISKSTQSDLQNIMEHLTMSCGPPPATTGSKSCAGGESNIINMLDDTYNVSDCTGPVRIGMISNNSNVQCAMSAHTNATDKLEQAAKNAAKAEGIFAGIIGALLLIVIIIIVVMSAPGKMLKSAGAILHGSGSNNKSSSTSNNKASASGGGRGAW